jgi:hypothetical protein
VNSNEKIPSRVEIGQQTHEDVPEEYSIMAEKKEAKSRREVIETGRDKRFVRRDEKGQFDEVSEMGRSLSTDRRQHAKTTVEPGQGDRGDQKRRSKK